MYQMGRSFCPYKFCSDTLVYIVLKSGSMRGNRVPIENVHRFRSYIWIVESPVFESILDFEFSNFKIEGFF